MNAGGEGVVGRRRLCQLVRQKAVRGDRDFEIGFLGGGSEACTFTFG